MIVAAAAVRPCGGNRGVIEAASAWRASGDSFALIIVVHVHGSTYRKPGALAAIRADGMRVGVISGGCLEPAVATLAAEALRNGAARIAEFDTRDDDDLVFGSGSGCRGLMRVVAIPALPGKPSLFDRLFDSQQRHQAHTLALRDIDDTLFTEGNVTIAATPSIVLFGAGPEMPALAGMARTLGWFVSVIDHRPALFDATRLIDVDRWIVARPASGIAELAPPACDAAIVMTHQAGADGEALRALAEAGIGYIGLLGPPTRRDELLALLDDNARSSLGGRLHAPVGIALGGEGPEAIALSIAAGVQRWLAARI